MTTLENIHELCKTQPEGLSLLNTIKVSIKKIKNHYNNCQVLQKIIEVKFEKAKAEGDGYSLQEILDICSGYKHDETEKFVLLRLQEYINSKIIKHENGRS